MSMTLQDLIDHMDTHHPPLTDPRISETGYYTVFGFVGTTYIDNPNTPVENPVMIQLTNWEWPKIHEDSVNGPLSFWPYIQDLMETDGYICALRHYVLDPVTYTATAH